MPSPTATSLIRAEKQEQYSNDGAWGPELNTGTIDRFDDAFKIIEVAVAGNVTLSVNNYVADEARSLGLIFTGAGGFTVTAPAVPKPYLVVNDCSAAVTLEPNGGTGASIGAGYRAWYYTDAAGTTGYFDTPKLNKLAAPDGDVDVNSQKITNVATATASTDAANKAFVEALIAASAAANLPSQTGNANKMLSTDGTTALWYAVRDILFPTQVIGNTGATQTFDLDDGLSFTCTLDQNSTFTFSNPATTGTTCAFYIKITNGGAYTITWPASVDWDAATAPTLQASGDDIVGFISYNGGTDWLGFHQWAAA